jgi:hypothetical protein
MYVQHRFITKVYEHGPDTLALPLIPTRIITSPIVIPDCCGRPDARVPLSQKRPDLGAILIIFVHNVDRRANHLCPTVSLKYWGVVTIPRAVVTKSVGSNLGGVATISLGNADLIPRYDSETSHYAGRSALRRV